MRRNVRYDSELIKIAAVKKVLKSLGEGTYSLINQYVMNVYGISFDVIEGNGSYSLEQLREALDNLLGEQSTKIILECVYLQLDEFSDAMNILSSSSHAKVSGRRRRNC